MGIEWMRNFPDGTRWAVCSNLMSPFVVDKGRRVYTQAQVLVPVEILDELSDEEIGRRVRSLVKDARSCYAVHAWNELYRERKKVFRNWEDSAARVEWLKSLFTEFLNYEGCEQEMRHALRFVEDFEQHVARKGLGRVNKKYERGRASKDYDALFVAVGRRDGFKCAACASVDDLHLDHVEPVGLGGRTHPDNLQLLCQPCNLRKGERTIDYRGTHQSDEIQ